jgi:hypothetical protein
MTIEKMLGNMQRTAVKNSQVAKPNQSTKKRK